MLAHTLIDRGDLGEKTILGKAKENKPAFWMLQDDSVKDVSGLVLIDALCENPDDADKQLLAGLMPIIGDEDLFVGENLTKKAWLEEVVRLIAEKYPGEDECFGKALEKYWGQLKEQTVKENSVQTKINHLTFSALCAARLRLWFDPREQAFYMYRPEKGIWSYLTGLEVQRLILDWLLKGGMPAVKPSLKFANQVVKHLNVIALYERTAITRNWFADAIGKHRIKREDGESTSFGPGKPVPTYNERLVDDYWVLPDLATELKTGGPANDCQVSAIVTKAGKMFSGGKPAMRANFDQRKFEPGTGGGNTVVAIPKPKE